MALTNKLTAIADAIRVQSGKTGKLTLDQMPNEIVDLQSLGFEVVGGTTSPTSPKENTIWVNTSTTITSWVFSATQPTGSSGMVWFQTEEKSTAPFNALKKNNITVCPVSAKQYVRNKWTAKTAKVRQNGAWVEVKLPGFYIFKSGEGALVSMKHMSGRNCSITPSADSIVYYTQSSGDLGEVSTTETAVSFAGYTTVNARAKSTFYPGGNAPCLGLVSTLPGSYSMRPNIASVEFTNDSVERVYSLPLPSGLDGAYIMIGGNFSGEVYDIWLE